VIMVQFGSLEDILLYLTRRLDFFVVVDLLFVEDFFQFRCDCLSDQCHSHLFLGWTFEGSS